MLIDRCIVEVKSGKGGDGAISFLHDKNTEWGGPDGGNGGRGGSVYFIAKTNVNTLYAFRHSPLFKAQDGENGGKTLKNGRYGDDLYIEVPVGTLIYEEGSGKLLADLAKDGQSAMVAEGGKGGKGNAVYKSSRRRIPKVAENGHSGIRLRLILELKLLADVGIVGLPSVGKSTFLNIVTRAEAKVAAYPFTTLVPNLGVTHLDDGRSFVIADMPGLIEGASEGKGLGTTFLRHIERCRVLLHFVSMGDEEDPYESYKSINEELLKYGAGLEKRPMIVVATKMDEEGAEEKKRLFDEELGFPSLPLSSFTREGVKAILKKAADTLEVTDPFPLSVEQEASTGEFKVYDAYEKEASSTYKIMRISPHEYRIIGREIEKKAREFDTSTPEGEEAMLAYLEKMEVEKRLKETGVKKGESVYIGNFEFTATFSD